MRKLVGVVLLAGCTASGGLKPAAPPTPSEPYGFTVEEEARILQLEDRREYDAALVERWIRHPNPLHRARIALALARIGPHTFIDGNGNGERDPTERQAGVDDLVALVSDPDINVRVVAAFALGQIGDTAALDTLSQFATDPNLLTRAYVLRALGAIAAPESLGVMIAALADPHPWVRTNALAAIARVGAKDPRALMKPEEALRVTIMTEDPDPGTRASSIDALGYYARQNEPARKRLMEIAGNGSRWERELAAGAIAKQFDDEKMLPADLSSWAKVRVLEAASPPSYRIR